ncbi:MAG: bifunctional histidinol-phosphatase/imidazoleglycerol-phosphate dehydratase HisB [Steroidobacteraceae bacterium]|nr:bifunctional histidinol-phosphatase/imidazoleglycerol-phosphate dehydratase HisB [Nevskiaceae bacterium]MCP5360028.1 bifunctional histidinol-phosphatase/imidazoleglycerol-phosphate dehydratase HisB [Nevskiaceae bacterium]MCP5472152.1 bifunctional histidinol-phosphatase/imidazoleglycerol-phosphate dehydratase HisB [Nevskiaceae bacterium]
MKVLFVDRDGTLIEEPADEQVDALDKIRFMPDVFASLQELAKAGWRLAIVTNQDGLGTASFPQQDYEIPQRFMLDAFASQGIEFEAVFVCPHRPADGCACRKPQTALLDDWIRERGVDLGASAVIGDRDTDLQLAGNLGIRGLRVRRHGTAAETWPAITRELLARRATVTRRTRETEIVVSVDLDATGPVRASTGIGFFDHMLEQLGKHGGFALELDCRGDLHIDEHHTIEDCALALGEALRRALGDKRGIARYGFLLPMDEARVQVAIDLSGRAYAVWEGQFGRDQVGGMPSELVPHFFRSLADALGAALHVSVVGDNTHHMIEACFKGVGRALRQAFRRESDDLPSTKGVL